MGQQAKKFDYSPISCNKRFYKRTIWRLCIIAGQDFWLERMLHVVCCSVPFLLRTLAAHLLWQKRLPLNSNRSLYMIWQRINCIKSLWLWQLPSTLSHQLTAHTKVDEIKTKQKQKRWTSRRYSEPGCSRSEGENGLEGSAFASNKEQVNGNGEKPSKKRMQLGDEEGSASRVAISNQR